MINIVFSCTISVYYTLFLMRTTELKTPLLIIIARCILFSFLTIFAPNIFYFTNCFPFNFLFIPIIYINAPILIYYYISAIICIIILYSVKYTKQLKLMDKIIKITLITAITFCIFGLLAILCLSNAYKILISNILFFIAGIIFAYLVIVIVLQFIYKSKRYKNNWYLKLTLFPHIYFIGMNKYLTGLDFNVKGLSKSEECNKKHEISKKQLEDFIDSLKRGLYLCDTNVFVYSKLKKYDKIYDFKVRDIYKHKKMIKNTQQTFFNIYGNNCKECDLDDATCKFSQKSIENYPYWLLFFMLKFRIK